MPGVTVPGPGVPPTGPEGPQGAPDWQSRIEVDAESKTIRLIGPVVEQMAHGFRKVLNDLDTMSRVAVHLPNATKMPPGWGEKPITVEIDSPGGDLYAGLLMYTEMRRVPSKIRTVALRHASSAALVILQGGDERETYPHILAVDHQLSTGFQGTAREILAFADHIRELQGEVDEIFEKSTGGKLPKEVKDAVVMGDVYLDAKKLLQYGFVDKIVDIAEPGAKPATLPAPEGLPLPPARGGLGGAPRGRMPLVVVPGGGAEGFGWGDDMAAAQNPDPELGVA